MGVLSSLSAIDVCCTIHDFKAVDIMLHLYTVILEDQLFEKIGETVYFLVL